MHRRIASARNVNRLHRARILEKAVLLNVNIASKRGFRELLRFARKKCNIEIDSPVLTHILQPAVVPSVGEISLEHKMLIFKEANRPNGTRSTPEGFIHLRRFAARECGILMGDSTLRRLVGDGGDCHHIAQRSTFVHPMLY